MRPKLGLQSQNRWKKGALTDCTEGGREEGRGGEGGSSYCFLMPTLNIVRKLQTNIVRYKTKFMMSDWPGYN